jgi:HPt (histidine-containing phosphotransfer) domain-containing protein
MPAFNYAAALQAADPEIIDIMAAPFLAALPQYLQDIETAASEQRHSDLRRHAHTLKGLAGNFGAEPIVSISHTIEELGKQEQSAEAQPLLTTLKNELREFITVLSASA